MRPRSRHWYTRESTLTKVRLRHYQLSTSRVLNNNKILSSCHVLCVNCEWKACSVAFNRLHVAQCIVLFFIAFIVELSMSMDMIWYLHNLFFFWGLNLSKYFRYYRYYSLLFLMGCLVKIFLSSRNTRKIVVRSFLLYIYIAYKCVSFWRLELYSICISVT